jgi:hypothetical protein
MSIQRRGKMVGNPHYTLTSEGYSKAINGALPDEIQEALKTTGIVVLENEETESMMFLVAEELKDSKNIKINEDDWYNDPVPGDFSGSLEFPGLMPLPNSDTVNPSITPGPNRRGAPGPTIPVEIDPSPTSPHPSGGGSSHAWIPGSSGYWARGPSGVWTWIPSIPGQWRDMGPSPWYEPWRQWLFPDGRSDTHHYHYGPNNTPPE